MFSTHFLSHCHEFRPSKRLDCSGTDQLQLEEQGRALGVHVDKGTEIGHIVLVGGQMEDVIYPFQRSLQVGLG